MEKEHKVLYKGKMVTTIDTTPTWESVLPLLFEFLQSDKPQVVANAKAEITRMAKTLDQYNAEAKKKAKE